MFIWPIVISAANIIPPMVIATTKKIAPEMRHLLVRPQMEENIFLSVRESLQLLLMDIV